MSKRFSNHPMTKAWSDRAESRYWTVLLADDGSKNNRQIIVNIMDGAGDCLMTANADSGT